MRAVLAKLVDAKLAQDGSLVTDSVSMCDCKTLEDALPEEPNVSSCSWLPHPTPDVWRVSTDGKEIEHVAHTTRGRHGRNAAVGRHLLPLGPLYHGTNILTYFAAESTKSDPEGLQPMPVITGTIGLTDASVPLQAQHGGFAFGVELLDGEWRIHSDACTSAEQRGSFMSPPRDPGDMIQFTVAADGSEVLVLMTLGKSTACRRFPIELTPDPGGMYLRPWCVSAYEGDCFRLAAVTRAERIEWMPTPATHRLFPPSARERAVALLLLGYHLAARRLPLPAQGAFCTLWVAGVLPLCVDHACDEHLRDWESQLTW